MHLPPPGVAVGGRVDPTRSPPTPSPAGNCRHSSHRSTTLLGITSPSPITSFIYSLYMTASRRLESCQSFLLRRYFLLYIFFTFCLIPTIVVTIKLLSPAFAGSRFQGCHRKGLFRWNGTRKEKATSGSLSPGALQAQVRTVLCLTQADTHASPLFMTTEGACTSFVPPIHTAHAPPPQAHVPYTPTSASADQTISST